MMELSSSFLGRFVLIVFCASGAMNLMLYIFIREPLMKGGQLLLYPYGRFSSNLTQKGLNSEEFVASYYRSDNDAVSMPTGQYIGAKRSPHAFRQLKVASQADERTSSPVTYANESTVFMYPINTPTDCSGDLTLMIVVISGVQNFERRHGIRHTWGSYTKNTKLNSSLIFMVGRGGNSEVQSQIEKESQLYGDIVQIDMVDSYRNLTLKSIAMLQWVMDYCYRVHHVLKTDDDMFINVPNLIKTLSSVSEKRFIMGHIFSKAEPVRNRNSKWFTSKEEYSDKYFPTYASGTAYAFPASVAQELHDAAAQTKLFWLEDIYITGMCAQAANISHLHNREFWYEKREPSGCEYLTAISGHEVTLTQMSKIFSELMASPTDCDNNSA